MSVQPEIMGSRLPLLDPQALSVAQKEIYDRLNTTMIPWADGAQFQSKTDDGRLIGPFKPGLFIPAITSRFLDLGTTNPIESTFATVRLRTHRTKGCGSRIATLTMVFKLGLEAQKHWRRLQGFELIPKVRSLLASVSSMAKNNPNRPLNQSFQQGCTRPRYTTLDNISQHSCDRPSQQSAAGSQIHLGYRRDW
jgi:hypothetical protein